MVGLMRSSDGSGVGKNSPGGRDETVMLYVTSSFVAQPLADLADRTRLAIVRLKSEDVIRIRANRQRRQCTHPNNRDSSCQEL